MALPSAKNVSREGMINFAAPAHLADAETPSLEVELSPGLVVPLPDGGPV